MSPQFVDFDADGHLDIVAGTFDGSAHLARGSAGGFTQPSHILDANGERIVINQWWNDDARRWDDATRCDPEGYQLPKGHCTSAVAFDWDGDGDHDLLLGDYDGGHVYLRVNEGTPGAPAFATRNVPVLANGKPLKVPGKVATPRLVDWDRDGLTDLLIGSFGDGYGNDLGGGVYLYRNTGKAGAPVFGEPELLVGVSRKGANGPTRPDAGLYPDVADVDGDGDLDLVVGGYSMWLPERAPLTEAEQARVAELQAQLQEIDREQRKLSEQMIKAAAGKHGDAATEARTQFLAQHRAEYTAVSKRRAEVQKELEPLVPTMRRESFVWLYENTSGKQKVAATRDM